MPGKTSFFYAIFKKLQATGRASNAHVNFDNDPNGNFGGFVLRSVDHANGMFGGLGPQATDVGLPVGAKPLVAGNFVPEENPVYAMLAASLGTDGALPDHVTVGGQDWPVMPPPLEGSIAMYPLWIELNGGLGNDRLVKALGDWIVDKKPDDTPHPAPLTHAALTQTPVPKFPYKMGESGSPTLFVASMPGDDGRRHGDGSMPDPAANHVPGDFWNTAQVFMTNELGAIVPAGQKLSSGLERYVTAVIGNAGNQGGGRLFFTQPRIEVRCDAQVFNTFTGPGVPLPSLSNLDPADTNPIYEQHYLQVWTRDIVGFRFNVDSVFAGLKQAMTDAGFTPAQLGGLSIEDWLKDGHACLKVRITKGENANNYTPQGAVPTLESNPTEDRHIAQRNVGQFNITAQGAKKIEWKKFIVAQAGGGMNSLALQHALAADTARLLVAVPRQTFERYLAKSLRGWEPVREVSSKPFPDAMILHQTTKGARLMVADHAKERFLGMSLGIEVDPAKARTARFGDVAIAHSAHDGSIVGGFTLKPETGR